MATPLLSLETQEHCFDTQFHPREPILAAATITGEVELHRFDLEASTAGRVRLIQSHKKSCRTAKFVSSSTQLLASTSADKFAALSDVETGACVWRCKLKAAGYSVLVLAGKERFAVGDDNGGLRIFDGRAAKAAVSWSENDDFIADLAMGTDGTSLCAVSGDGTLAVYDIRKGGEKGLIAMSDFQDDELLSIAIVKQGTKVICGTQTGPLPIFSWGDFGDQKDRIKGHPMSVDAMVKLSEDGILTGSSDGKIRVVAVHSKGLGSGVLGLLGEHGSAEYPMERLALSADEKLLASTAHGKPSVLLWSTEEARRLLAGETWAEIFGEEAAGIPAGEAENEEVDSSDEDERPTKRQKLRDKRKKKKAAPGGLGNQKQQQAARFFSGL